MHQRQNTTLSLIVGTKDQQQILQRDDQDKGPEDRTKVRQGYSTGWARLRALLRSRHGRHRVDWSLCRRILHRERPATEAAGALPFFRLFRSVLTSLPVEGTLYLREMTPAAPRPLCFHRIRKTKGFPARRCSPIPESAFSAGTAQSR